MRASERVHSTLRREIVDGDLAPGTVLGEVEQSARLGVSRTPLREALGRLATEGLVTANGARGFIVAGISAERIVELFDVRAALEAKAAGLAALHRDRARFERLREEFQNATDLVSDGDPHHRRYYQLSGELDEAIDEAADNAYLAALLAGVRTHVARIRRLSQDDPERLRAATTEHLMIIDAIIDGSESLAAHATELHLSRSLAAIRRAIEAAPATRPDAITRPDATTPPGTAATRPGTATRPDAITTPHTRQTDAPPVGAHSAATGGRA